MERLDAFVLVSTADIPVGDVLDSRETSKRGGRTPTGCTSCWARRRWGLRLHAARAHERTAVPLVLLGEEVALSTVV